MYTINKNTQCLHSFTFIWEKSAAHRLHPLLMFSAKAEMTIRLFGKWKSEGKHTLAVYCMTYVKTPTFIVFYVSSNAVSVLTRITAC